MLGPLTTTGIGSLPHRNVEAALDEAFRMDVPYLPQLPMRDAREFMLVQAADGLPGLIADDQGMVTIDLEEWKKGATAYDQLLERAFGSDEYAPFLPTATSMSAFEPFIARIRAEKTPAAKIQVAGPMTIQWTLRTTENRMAPPVVLTQLSKTILARGLAMIDAVKSTGAAPIIFVDEPGLYAFSKTQPGHIVMLQELRINLMALRKRGATIGIHCCSDADWAALLGLGIDVLAIDAALSLKSLLKAGEALIHDVTGGGKLALGVIPTDSQRLEDVDVRALFAELQRDMSTLTQYFPARASMFQQILNRSLLTPACGLAFLSEDEASAVVERLEAFRGLFRTKPTMAPPSAR